MPRSDPAKSIKLAGKHLFRHLDDIRYLRRNPIAAPFFPPAVRGRRRSLQQDLYGLEKLRASLTLAIDRCRQADLLRMEPYRAKRRYYIAIRDFIDRDAPRNIASDLGLSMRQYYRERQTLIDDLISHLAEKPRSGFTTEEPIDPHQELLGTQRRSRILLEINAPGLAIEHLRNALKNISNEQAIVEGLCAAAELLAEGKPAGFRNKYYKEARSTLHNSEMDEVTRDWCQARIALTKARIERSVVSDDPVLCNANLAVSLAQAATRHAEHLNLLFSSVALRARSHWAVGRHTEAVRDLVMALGVEGQSDVSPHERIGVHIWLGQTLGCLGDLKTAMFHGQCAAELANKAGLPQSEATALELCLQIAETRGQLGRWTDQRQGLLDRFGDLIPESQRLCFNLHSASAARTAGQVRYARRILTGLDSRLNKWKALYPVSAYLWLVEDAYCQLAEGNPRAGLTSARDALELLTDGQYTVSLGGALRLAGIMHYACGQRREAGDYLSDSIAILQQQRHMPSLEKSYRASATITRNRRHQSMADELLRMITESGPTATAGI